MEGTKLIELYRERTEQLVTLYLERISRISGVLTASSISNRFWEFNVLMEELEQTLSAEASKMFDLYAVSDGDQSLLQPRMQQIARDACQRFNKEGKPGSSGSGRKSQD